MAECKLSHPSLIDKSDDLFHIQGRERERERERDECQHSPPSAKCIITFTFLIFFLSL